MELFLVIVLAIGAIAAYHQHDQAERMKNVEKMRADRVLSAKDGNRRLLRNAGDDRFIRYYGKDQYDLIKQDKDTQLVELRVRG